MSELLSASSGWRSLDSDHRGRQPYLPYLLPQSAVPAQAWRADFAGGGTTTNRSPRRDRQGNADQRPTTLRRRKTSRPVSWRRQSDPPVDVPFQLLMNPRNAASQTATSSLASRPTTTVAPHARVMDFRVRDWLLWPNHENREMLTATPPLSQPDVTPSSSPRSSRITSTRSK